MQAGWHGRGRFWKGRALPHGGKADNECADPQPLGSLDGPLQERQKDLLHRPKDEYKFIPPLHGGPLIGFRGNDGRSLSDRRGEALLHSPNDEHDADRGCSRSLSSSFEPRYAGKATIEVLVPPILPPVLQEEYLSVRALSVEPLQHCARCLDGICDDNSTGTVLIRRTRCRGRGNLRSDRQTGGPWKPARRRGLPRRAWAVDMRQRLSRSSDDL